MVQAQAQGLGTAVVQAMVLAWVLAGALAQEQEQAVFQTLAQVQVPAGFQAQAQGWCWLGPRFRGWRRLRLCRLGRAWTQLQAWNQQREMAAG